MKILAVLASALAIVLASAGTASAQRFAGGSVTETRTSTDAFGNQRTVTSRRNSDGSASVTDTRTGTDRFGNRRTVTSRRNSDGSASVTDTRTGTDRFGNRRSVTSTTNDDGSVRCRTVTSRATDAF